MAWNGICWNVIRYIFFTFNYMWKLKNFYLTYFRKINLLFLTMMNKKQCLFRKEYLVSISNNSRKNLQRHYFTQRKIYKVVFLTCSNIHFIKPYRDQVHLHTGSRQGFIKQTVSEVSKTILIFKIFLQSSIRY